MKKAKTLIGTGAQSDEGTEAQRHRGTKYLVFLRLCAFATLCLCALLASCTDIGGYSNKRLFPEDVSSVCLKMFDNQTFRRGVEYELSDALAKRIEAETPYKLISSSDRADSLMSGQIVQITESVLSIERELGFALEKQVQVRAVVNWKNLKTGQLLIDNQSVTAEATYSEFQKQDFSYASALAANKLAQKIVEMMENKW